MIFQWWFIYFEGILNLPILYVHTISDMGLRSWSQKFSPNIYTQIFIIFLPAKGLVFTSNLVIWIKFFFKLYVGVELEVCCRTAHHEFQCVLMRYPSQWVQKNINWLKDKWSKILDFDNAFTKKDIDGIFFWEFCPI